MKPKIIIMTAFSLFTCIGCNMAQKKQPISVSFDYSVESINYRLAATVKKDGDTYNASYQDKQMQNPVAFDFTAADFDELTKIIAKMNKPAKNRKHAVTDESRVGTFTVVLNRKGKDVTYEYKINKFSSEKENNLKNEAIDLIKKCIDRHKKKSEIRVGWRQVIPPTYEVYAHAEPAELVEYLGKFVEKSNSKKNMCGGSESGTFRWKALKPGVVTVWVEESRYHHDPKDFPALFEPFRCYIIDENLNVHYSEEETEVAKNRFKQNNN